MAGHLKYTDEIVLRCYQEVKSGKSIRQLCRETGYNRKSLANRMWQIGLIPRDQTWGEASFARRAMRSDSDYLARISKMNIRNRKVRRAYRDIVLDHYGRACECCGESTFEFLALDHSGGKGDGAQHRRDNGLNSGWETYKWIIDNGFPEGFRVLCHNCNSAYGFYGYCPHQEKVHVAA